METTVFNNAQLHLLHMMSYINTNEELDDLKNVISDYFAKKVDDNKFVDCAIVAGALCIVSNDAHFKVLADIPFPNETVSFPQNIVSLVGMKLKKSNITPLSHLFCLPL